MNLKFIGGLLLLVGTSIGAGMLALPVVMAQGGLLGATLLLLCTWMVMTLGAFLVLEVNLWFPPGSNLITMAQTTLGPHVKWLVWIVYLLLLYSLLAAYIAGGSSIFMLLLELIHIHLDRALSAILFIVLWGGIVFLGIQSVDYVNRAILFAKFGVFFLLVLFMSWHIRVSQFSMINPNYLLAGATVVITSFGFATIVPTLRSYFNDDVRTLRRVVFYGSLVPLICYLIWVSAIFAEIPLHGPHGLLEISQSSYTTAALTKALIFFLHNSFMGALASLFTSFCILTSFLGVSLCLSDFFADGLAKKKRGWGNILIYVATFIPPLLISLMNPRIFVVALSYAGIFCILLLVLLPAAMAWSGRYRQQMIISQPGQYRVWGGKWLLSIIMFIAVAMIIYSVIPVIKFV